MARELSLLLGELFCEMLTGGAFSKRSMGHLTKGARDTNIRVQMAALATLFHLLDAFARQNSAHAPIMHVFFKHTHTHTHEYLHTHSQKQCKSHNVFCVMLRLHC